MWLLSRMALRARKPPAPCNRKALAEFMNSAILPIFLTQSVLNALYGIALFDNAAGPGQRDEQARRHGNLPGAIERRHRVAFDKTLIDEAADQFLAGAGAEQTPSSPEMDGLMRGGTREADTDSGGENGRGGGGRKSAGGGSGVGSPGVNGVGEDARMNDDADGSSIASLPAFRSNLSRTLQEEPEKLADQLRYFCEEVQGQVDEGQRRLRSLETRIAELDDQVDAKVRRIKDLERHITNKNRHAESLANDIADKNRRAAEKLDKEIVNRNRRAAEKLEKDIVNRNRRAAEKLEKLQKDIAEKSRHTEKLEKDIASKSHRTQDADKLISKKESQYVQLAQNICNDESHTRQLDEDTINKELQLQQLEPDIGGKEVQGQQLEETPVTNSLTNQSKHADDMGGRFFLPLSSLLPALQTRLDPIRFPPSSSHLPPNQANTPDHHHFEQLLGSIGQNIESGPLGLVLKELRQAVDVVSGGDTECGLAKDCEQMNKAIVEGQETRGRDCDQINSLTRQSPDNPSHGLVSMHKARQCDVLSTAGLQSIELRNQLSYQFCSTQILSRKYPVGEKTTAYVWYGDSEWQCAAAVGTSIPFRDQTANFPGLARPSIRHKDSGVMHTAVITPLSYIRKNSRLLGSAPRARLYVEETVNLMSSDDVIIVAEQCSKNFPASLV
ncbi:uncharacterized protein MYCFIDRAFT_180170 [Pseudocercospora fijiensis CIRAD86]|uniref:Uncharacterized protein n=1 Tax=Pseudocercospora fijiensis (strain CIRAD86) TaxID=383855 RepID=M2ZYH1_PSEFD|nr:uncharacterized protein MYCFIDRAFT_180170 [Pseudocercospora fijiensis CIRAD86]EME77161.1 hypothetical protein MYCFIDRAFT_180170 [Pseudocercospora fijiensis CIRAD86]